jgi:hypothetical protein
MEQINNDCRHLMRLLKQDPKTNGWVRVSDILWPFIKKIPLELIHVKQTAEGNFARLSYDGEVVVKWTIPHDA